MYFSMYVQVEEAMSEVVAETFYSQPFFRDLLNGAWSFRFLEYFTVQYHYYSANFPRVLGAAISAMEPDDTWWIPLADNLWDEAGRGQPDRSHARLYQTFALSVMGTAQRWNHALAQWPVSPAVTTAVKTLLTYFHHADPLQAMAAIGLGSELFAGEVMGLIGRGLRHPVYQQAGPIDTRFWTIHADSDEPRHYQLCRNVLLAFRDSESFSRMFAAGQAMALSEADMYHQLYYEGQHL